MVKPAPTKIVPVIYPKNTKIAAKIFTFDQNWRIMNQELIDLRNSILAGRYTDALTIVDQLAGMNKQAILRQIQFFLVRLMVNLIKNQLEQRLTNYWVAAISDSIRQIKKLNLQDNQTDYYVNINELESMLEEEFEAAIDAVSASLRDGIYTPFELIENVDKIQIMNNAKILLSLTYEHSAKSLSGIVKDNLVQLPGGQDWQAGRRINWRSLFFY